MSTENEDWVTIPVPKRLAPSVYALIAKEMAPVMPTEVVTAEQVPDGSASWTSEEIKRLVEESPPAMKVILELLAKNPDKWLDSAVMAEALKTRLKHFGGENKPEANWNTVAGTLGAYGRRVKSRYGKDEWFHKARPDPQGHWKHLMPGEYADQVLEFLNTS